MINKMNSPLFEKGLTKWNTYIANYVGKYDFSNSVYAGMNNKIFFICPKHGKIDMDAKNVISGKTCKKCSFEERGGKKRTTQTTYIARASLAHKNKYTYEYVKYSGLKNKIKIVCPEHGIFEQTADDHINGAGCKKCFHTYHRGKSQIDTLDSFNEKLNNVFSGCLKLLSKEYLNSQEDIFVTCTKHGGELISKPYRLSAGENPCTRCNHMKSAPEQAIADYLSIFTDIKQRDKLLIKPKELDIYIPTSNLAIEFHGMYWHSHFNNDDEDKDKHKTYDKYKACAEKNIRLITIYETEWQNRQPQIKRLLRNAIGKTKGKLMARKCQVSMVPHTEAKAFFEKYHPQGGDGSGTHYGIYWKTKLVACMRFSLGSNDRGNTKTRDWTLSRYATRVNVLGGASKLFKAFVKEQDPDLIKSFSDNRYFSGGMYEQLGFELVSESMPDYQVWSQKKGLFPKSHYQRRNIQKRLLEHGKDEVYNHETDERTEREMTYLMGAGRIYDCGKKKWVWTK